MTDISRLNRTLQSLTFPQRHSIPVGKEFDIELPRAPMTGDTEFVELRADLSGVCEELDIAIDEVLEGAMLPKTVHARAVRPGHGVIRISALDALSQQPIEGVEPLEIVVDVQEP